MDPKFQVIYFALKQKGIFHKPRGRFFRTKRFGAAVLFFLEVGLFGRRGCPEQHHLLFFGGAELRQISGTISTISTISTMRTISTIS